MGIERNDELSVSGLDDLGNRSELFKATTALIAKEMSELVERVRELTLYESRREEDG